MPHEYEPSLCLAVRCDLIVVVLLDRGDLGKSSCAPAAKWQGKRFIGHAGHARLRHVLYIATISALRFNPIIKRHYERLIQKGKPGKVAVIAAERKLLTIAWACVKYERMFDPEYEGRDGRGKGDEEA
jgi:hypothetical protein